MKKSKDVFYLVPKLGQMSYEDHSNTVIGLSQIFGHVSKKTEDPLLSQFNSTKRTLYIVIAKGCIGRPPSNIPMYSVRQLQRNSHMRVSHVKPT